MSEHYDDLAQSCPHTQDLKFDVQSKDSVFEQLAAHDLFTKIMTGEPQQIKNIANLFP